MCILKDVIISEKGIVRTRNHLDLIISDFNDYFFRTNMQTCILKLWQDEEIFHDMEGLVLNPVEIPVEIQDIENFQNLEAKSTHSIL